VSGLPLDLLIPLMPFLAALPLAVAAVVIAKLWQRRRDAPVADLETQNQEMREELATLRRELTEAQERLDFAERVLTQQGRTDRLPDAPDK
jgi:membrane protein implicated in regulation of membrane protease activity